MIYTHYYHQDWLPSGSLNQKFKFFTNHQLGSYAVGLIVWCHEISIIFGKREDFGLFLKIPGEYVYK